MDWGNKNLSAFEFTEDENKNITFAEAKRYEDSQDYALKQAATKQLDLIEATLQTIENEGGAAVSDRSILDNNTLKDMRLAMF
jgi:predicted TPR repeat methyltransferase